MRFLSCWLVVGILLAVARPGAAQAPATAPAGDRAATGDAELINQLADRDPAVREEAMQALRKRGPAAKRALREAAGSPRAAIADAAQTLLAEIPWAEPTDPPLAKMLLKDYGTLPVADRITRLNRLLRETDADRATLPARRRAVLRVLADESAPEVAWGVLASYDPDGAWGEAIRAEIDADAPNALRMFKARHLHLGGQTGESLKLMEQVVESELREPTTTFQSLQWPIKQLTARDRAQGAFVQAARRLRAAVQRSEPETAPGGGDLEETLLELQARHGPLPGFAEDLTRETTPAGQARQAITMAMLCERVGSGLAPLLLDPVLAEKSEEAPAVRAQRLFEAGTFLARLGRMDQATQVLEEAADLPGDAGADPALDMAAGQADLRLYDLYMQREAHQKAGQRLERAMKRMPNIGLLVVRPDGRREAWAAEEIVATIHWHYFKHAQEQKETPAMQEQARLVMASGSTDSGKFLDVLPTLEQIADAEETRAYFERVYAVAKAQLDKSDKAPLYLNDLAWLCARAGRHLEQAVAWAEQAVAAKPEEAAYLDTLAEAKFRVGAIDEAIALEERALQRRPDDTFMQEQLARFRAAAATRPAK